MKILFLHRWSGVHEGGTETEVKTLSRFLNRRGHAVSLMTYAGQALSNFDPQITIFALRPLARESLFSYHINDPRLYLYTFLYMAQAFFYLMFLYLVKRVRFDLISVHFYTEAKVARLIRFLTKTPYVFVLEGYTDREAAEARFANLSFCISSHDQEQCFQKFGYRPVLKTIGVDLERFYPIGDSKKLSLKSKLYGEGVGTICLSVCRIEPRKDLLTLIRCARLLREKGLNVRFAIIGEGILESGLKTESARLGLGEVVTFLGRMNDVNLPLYYQAADVFVLPTLYEGFGIVFLEAMACGLPVISTRVGAVPEVVGDCGILIEPGDPVSLAESISSLYLTPERRKKMGDCGYSRVIEKFDQEKLIGLFEDRCLNLILRKVKG